MTEILAPLDGTTRIHYLGDALSAIHDRWIPRLAQVLSPAMAPQSRFWQRWEITRRYTGEFQCWLQMEYALVESLGGGWRLRPGCGWRLCERQWNGPAAS